jgi:hypothetical protein
MNGGANSFESEQPMPVELKAETITVTDAEVKQKDEAKMPVELKAETITVTDAEVKQKDEAKMPVELGAETTVTDALVKQKDEVLKKIDAIKDLGNSSLNNIDEQKNKIYEFMENNMRVHNESIEKAKNEIAKVQDRYQKTVENAAESINQINKKLGDLEGTNAKNNSLEEVHKKLKSLVEKMEKMDNLASFNADEIDKKIVDNLRQKISPKS